MSLKHCKSIKAGERKGVSKGPPLVLFAGCPVAISCLLATKSVSQVPSCSLSASCCSLAPQGGLDLGQSGHLTREATSAPCEGWRKLSRGGNRGAQQC